MDLTALVEPSLGATVIGPTVMANVSWVCPTIHPDLSIADEGTPGHSILFREPAEEK